MNNQVLVTQQANPSALINLALEKGSSVETLERLFILQKEWEANEARKAFVQAMADFKSEPMVIAKNKLVSYTTDKGTTQYHHAELSDVVAVVVPMMAKHGLSHRWSVEQKDADITVSCIITHSLGHSESVSITARPDTSGGKNAIQAIASAISYLQRYTILASTGMATGGDDDDGIGSGFQYEPVNKEALEKATAAAKNGKAAFTEHWAGLDVDSRKLIMASLQELRDIATKADAVEAADEQ